MKENIHAQVLEKNKISYQTGWHLNKWSKIVEKFLFLI